MKIISLTLPGLLSLILVASVNAAEQSSAQPAELPAVVEQEKDTAKNEEDSAKKVQDDKRAQHEARGDEHLQRRRFREAIEEFDAAIAMDPKAARLYVKKGIALYSGGKPKEALPLMDKAVQLIGDDESEAWWPLYHKGMALGVSGDMEGAIKNFSASIKLKPNHENYSGRARGYIQQQKPEQALADIKAALRHDPNHRQLKALAAHLESQVETQKASAAFLKAMAAKKGAQKTDSGLIYFELKKGEGKSPNSKDTVKVHYHGTLYDGTVFDSSVSRGQPISFSLTQVIPCWTEGLQKMRVGGKARLICPAEIAYGNRGGGPIKPGSALAFEVELLGIE